MAEKIVTIKGYVIVDITECGLQAYNKPSCDWRVFVGTDGFHCSFKDAKLFASEKSAERKIRNLKSLIRCSLYQNHQLKAEPVTASVNI
jgi:hypothetical protein